MRAAQGGTCLRELFSSCTCPFGSHSRRECLIPQGERPIPCGESLIPSGEWLVPHGEWLKSTGKEPFPLGNACHSPFSAPRRPASLFRRTSRRPGRAAGRKEGLQGLTREQHLWIICASVARSKPRTSPKTSHRESGRRGRGRSLANEVKNGSSQLRRALRPACLLGIRRDRGEPVV
jgi:hypothetical protein